MIPWIICAVMGCCLIAVGFAVDRRGAELANLRTEHNVLKANHQSLCERHKKLLSQMTDLIIEHAE